MSNWLTAEKAQWASCTATFKKYSALVLKTACIGMFLCHFLFLFYGNSSPDGTNEGLFYFWNQNWHLSIGRWFVRYLSAMGGNVVMPAVFMAINALCTAAAMLLLADLWHIESKLFLVLGTLAMVSAPSVIEQYLVIHVAYTYGLSLLMTVLAAYLVLHKKGILSFLSAVLLLTLSMGCYQAWIGFATGTIVMTLMLDCLDERPLPEILRRAGKALAMGLAGAAVYFVILQIELHRYNVELSDKGGIASFGAGSFFGGLGSKILQAYRDFKDYFTTGPNHTGKALLLILLGTALLLFLGWLRLVRRRKPQAILLAVLAVLLPLAVNVVDIIIEGNINTLMSHPMQLMVIFALVLAGRASGPVPWQRLVRLAASAAVVLLCWLSTVTAYASYRTVALAYEYVDTLTNAILTRVLNDSDYTPDTRVLIAGLPDESEAQKFNFLYDKSAYTKNMVFWDGRAGVLGNWKHYIYDYHGLWIGEISTDEYYDIIDSSDFAAMPVYPAEGSLEKFDDILVVKLEENPPR